MNVITQEHGSLTVVEIEGRFDAFGVQAVTDVFNKVAENDQPRLVVDLSRVEFIDSMALATLVKGLKRMREKGGNFALCNLQQAVQIIFELTRLDKAFDIYSTLEEAAEAMQ